MIYRTLTIACFIIASLSGHSSFAQVDEAFLKEHISRKVYPVDSEAAAVVLYESRSITITKEVNGSSYHYKQDVHVSRIIKIMSSSAFDLANVRIHYQDDNFENYVEHIVGQTYNLTGAEVQETKIKKEDVFRKEVDKHHIELSFSLPGVREGSIIEYSYDIISPVRTVLPKWDIQGAYPKLVSTYSISYPLHFEFTSISHVRFSQKEYPSQKDAIAGVDKFCHVSHKPGFPDDPMESFWLRRDIPAIKEEPYVINRQNSIEDLSLQLTGYMELGGMKHVENSWDKLNQELLTNEYFGIVNNNNKFLDDIVDSLVKTTPDMPRKARAIYNYMRSNFSCNGEYYNYQVKHSLQDVYKKKRGNSFELNLLLCALLVHADVSAAPLLIGTTSVISPSPAFPALDRFNYLACAVKYDSGYILLDASDKDNPYGILPPQCYNGYARVISKPGVGIMLNTDRLMDKSITGVKITDITNASAKIEITQKPGIMTSSALRKRWHKDEQSKKDYLNEHHHPLPENIKIIDTKVKQEDDPDTSLTVVMSGTLKFDKNVNMFYINAQVVKTFDKNPFTATVRSLPIEFPCRQQFQYYFTIVLPAGLEPSDIPKPSKVKLENDYMVYSRDYNYYENMRMLSVNSVYNLNVTSYPPDYYEPIRTFFQNMVKRESEVITLKREDKK